MCLVRLSFRTSLFNFLNYTKFSHLIFCCLEFWCRCANSSSLTGASVIGAGFAISFARFYRYYFGFLLFWLHCFCSLLSAFFVAALLLLLAWLWFFTLRLAVFGKFSLFSLRCFLQLLFGSILTDFSGVLLALNTANIGQSVDLDAILVLIFPRFDLLCATDVANRAMFVASSSRPNPLGATWIVGFSPSENLGYSKGALGVIEMKFRIYSASQYLLFQITNDV